GRSGYSKTRLSELLRGKGYYPGWEITYSVVRALDIPVGPLLRLWKAAAVEADKPPTWIHNRIRQVQPADREDPPLAHTGLTQAMWKPYSAYAQAFLQS
ncbi:XRE family transcriptional regulator, partial [Streptomyces canus]